MGLRDYIRHLYRLRGAFRGTFLNDKGKPHPDAEVVLCELRRFCYGAKPTIKTVSRGTIDPYASIAAAARQEVYFRVLSMIRLDDADIAMMERSAAAQEQM